MVKSKRGKIPHPASKRGQYKKLNPYHEFELAKLFKSYHEGELDEDKIKEYIVKHEGSAMPERTYNRWKNHYYKAVLKRGPGIQYRKKSNVQMELEEEVALFMDKWTANNDMTKAQVATVCRAIRDAKYSNRDCEKVKKLKFTGPYIDGLLERKGFGKATSKSNAAPMTDAEIKEERDRLRTILQDFRCENWINADETGLNFTSTACSNPLIKKTNQYRRSLGIKQRITVGKLFLSFMSYKSRTHFFHFFPFSFNLVDEKGTFRVCF